MERFQRYFKLVLFTAYIALMASNALAQFQISGAENIFSLIRMVLNFVLAIALLFCIFYGVTAAISLAKGDPQAQQRLVHVLLAVLAILIAAAVVNLLAGFAKQSGVDTPDTMFR